MTKALGHTMMLVGAYKLSWCPYMKFYAAEDVKNGRMRVRVAEVSWVQV